MRPAPTLPRRMVRPSKQPPHSASRWRAQRRPRKRPRNKRVARRPPARPHRMGRSRSTRSGPPLPKATLRRRPRPRRATTRTAPRPRRRQRTRASMLPPERIMPAVPPATRPPRSPSPSRRPDRRSSRKSAPPPTSRPRMWSNSSPCSSRPSAPAVPTASLPAPPPPTQPTSAVPIAGLALEIAARVQSGRSRFEIRLDPPELGRIDVRLDVDRSGQVTSRLVVDKAETLDLLRRDAPELERALQQAGLKTGDNGLQFALRDQTGGQNQADWRALRRGPRGRGRPRDGRDRAGRLWPLAAARRRHRHPRVRT